MDLLLKDLDPERSLPFEGAPAPDLFVLIFRQFWGEGGGLGLIPVSVETPNCERVKMKRRDVGEVLVESEGDGDGIVEQLREDRELTNKKAHAAGANHPTQSPSVMTADTGLETRGMESDGAEPVWRFDFGDSFVELDGGLTDEDTVTSMASEETLAKCST
jgi:hypothetical protein